MKLQQVLILIALAALVICVLSVLFVLMIRAPHEEQVMETPVNTPTKEILAIDTPKGRLIKGDVAYLDGRDPDAQPPLTVMNIRIWDDVPRIKPVCELRHGTEVDILDIRYYAIESRHYLLIVGDGCQGWLPETFLSDTRHDPIGDQL